VPHAEIPRPHGTAQSTREGYGSIDVTKANLDSVGDAAATAAVAAKPEASQNPEEHGDHVYRRALRPFVVL